MATVRELVTKWGFKVDDRPLRRIDSRIANVKKSLNGLASLSTKIGIGFGVLSFGIGRLLREAGDFEQVEIAFEVLTQSQEKAKRLMSDLIDFAVKTPFTLRGVTDSTKQLLAYGIESENMIDTLTALGNVAAGVGKDKLPQLTLAFGQVRAAGRLRGQEVRQFTEAGVPINELIAKEFGIAGSEVQDFVSKGMVNFERFNNAFQDMANGTGRFTGLMERQSKTLLGVYSNLKDAIQVLAIQVGGSLVPEATEYLNVAIEWLKVNKELIRVNVSKSVKVLVDGMKNMVKVGRAVARVLGAVINSVGGFDNAVKILTTSLAVLLGLRVLTFMGNIGILAVSGAKNLLVFVAASRSAAFALFAMQAAALALPIAVGAAIAAMFLIIEDFIVFMQGGDSLIGSLVDNFDEGGPAFLRAFDNFEKLALAKISEFFAKVNNFISGEEFADDRKRLADGLLAALDVAIVGSTLLAKIGFSIGQAIFDGVVDAFIEGSPRLAGFLGLTSDRQRKSKRKSDTARQGVTGAAGAIKKFGLEDASKAFSPEDIAKARQFTESPAGKIISALQKRKRDVGGSAIDFADPSGKLGAALADGIIELSELQEVSGSLKELSKLTGVDTRQLISGRSGTPLSQKGRNAQAPIKFETKVEIIGSGLNEDQLEQAVTKGVNAAQEKTARDIMEETQSAVVN